MPSSTPTTFFALISSRATVTSEFAVQPATGNERGLRSALIAASRSASAFHGPLASTSSSTSRFTNSTGNLAAVPPVMRASYCMSGSFLPAAPVSFTITRPAALCAVAASILLTNAAWVLSSPSGTVVSNRLSPLTPYRGARRRTTTNFPSTFSPS